jgi:hypothetical protein
MSKLFNTEVASIIKEQSLYKWATKVNNKFELSSEDKEITEVMDAFARELGKTGKNSDNNTVIAEYIKQVIEPEVYNPNESILSDMFNIGSIGEFDEKAYTGLPKNTIKVFDAVRGGNVQKSFVDPGVFTPVSFALQAETEIDYSDLRRNGFKSIARMTQLAEEALNNEKFYRIFQGVDNALGALTGDQDIDSGSALTLANMDTFTTYLNDMAEGNPFMIGLSKITNPIRRMDGFESFLSEEMKNEFNRLGKVGLYSGVRVEDVPTARKTANGKFLIPEKRIFGIAGKIGDMDMKGELRYYETPDHDAEKIRLKFTGFDVTYVIYYLQKMARITLD